MALYEQNFREDPAWPLARTQKEATFKKNRSRGAAKATAAILTCTAELRVALIKRGRIYVGWQSVEVTDYVDVTCCSKCQQYGHPERYCRSKETTRCGATGHAAGECKAEETCCATCKRLEKRGAAGPQDGFKGLPGEAVRRGQESLHDAEQYARSEDDRIIDGGGHTAKAGVYFHRRDLACAVLRNLSTNHCLVAHQEDCDLHVVSAYFQNAEDIGRRLHHLERVMEELHRKRFLFCVDANTHSPMWLLRSRR
ncbi:hypothetical protein PYW07_012519 [Mythimna separata]|uniref:Uncharacterized protein n=1 Tax=Mythimna separata TaxID=271217 RepID=A0AAD7Y8G5_MYTSE|nr:hypothetical protein PYW07_012519 [Mythimna separata]